MKIKIEEAVHFQTFGIHTIGFGIVSLVDKRNHHDVMGDGTPLFSHRMMENNDYNNLTEEQRNEVKNDCHELVRLLKKFYHTSEFVEV